MVISSRLTPELMELGVSRKHGKQNLEKTVWVISAGFLSSVLDLPASQLIAGVAGSFSVWGSRRNTCSVFLSLLAGFSGWSDEYRKSSVCFRSQPSFALESKGLCSALGAFQHLASCWLGFGDLVATSYLMIYRDEYHGNSLCLCPFVHTFLCLSSAHCFCT